MVDNNVKKDNDSRKIFGMIVLILSLMICTTSATYAYFSVSASSNNVVSGTAATASLSLTVNKIKPTATGSGKLVPQYSVLNSKNTLKSAIDANCIDANSNLICQVYTIVVTNGGTSNLSLNGTFTLTAANMTNLKWYVIASGTGSTPTTTYTYPSTLTAVYGNAKTTTALGSTISLSASASYYYVVVVWIEETGSAQSDSGTFTGVVAFNASNGLGGITSTIRS